MPDTDSTPLPARDLLDDVRVAPDVFGLRPDYRALVVVVNGLAPGPSDERSEALLRRAETSAARLVAQNAGEAEAPGAPALTDVALSPTAAAADLPHIAAWREAYRAFGAKPQRTRNSLEALTIRATADGGLPRVNRLTDIYNAISVLHQVPVGGEDLSGYRGAPRLLRATGAEPFDTVSGGSEVTEHPEPGEVVWADDAGVTCRRWNWRQGRRTRLTDTTTDVLFILDALTPMTDDALVAAGEELIAHVSLLGSPTGPAVRVARRLISRSTA